ncbi:4-coumarate--CoA ligase 1 [Yarrowia sp. C11]|nr:4-coumarate--CoA ligase 1 [Yarrowia sp. C11]
MPQIIHKSAWSDLPLSTFFYGNVTDYLRSKKSFGSDKMAYIDAETDEGITYKQLWNLANGISAVLFHNYGIGHSRAPVSSDHTLGDVVMLHAPNSRFFPSLHYGMLDMGCTITSASVSYDVKDLAHQLRVTDASLVLCYLDKQNNVRQAIKEAQKDAAFPGISHPVRILLIEDLLTMASNISAEKISAAMSRRFQYSPKECTKRIAYLSMSSGTTGGIPKAVRLTHFNMSSCDTLGTLSTPSFSTGDDIRVAAIVPMTHQYGLTKFLFNMCSSHATTIVHRQFDLVKLLESQKKYKLNRLMLVPPVIVKMAKDPAVEPYIASLYEHVDFITTGAAPLPGSAVTNLLTRITGNPEGIRHSHPNRPPLTISQGYGLTETSPLCAVFDPLDPDVDFRSAGKATSHVEIRIVAENGQDQPTLNLDHLSLLDEMLKRDDPLPVGEVLIRGPMIMDGYHKNFESSQESFERSQEDPKTLIHWQDKWLKTGDIGMVDQKGRLVIVDRNKEMIKSMSKQVAPAELESLLLNHDQVIDCAVIGSKSRRG